MRGTRVPRTSRKAKNDLNASLEYVTRERQVLVFRTGKKLLAALVPLDDEQQLEALEDELDRREAQEATKEPSIPWEKVKQDLAL